jgi:ABC-type multidrug transport system permease subunit
MCISYKGGSQPGTTFWVVQLQNYQQYEIRWNFFFIFIFIQVWTQKCAVQKASVDVNITYY